MVCRFNGLIYLDLSFREFNKLVIKYKYEYKIFFLLFFVFYENAQTNIFVKNAKM